MAKEITESGARKSTPRRSSEYWQSVINSLDYEVVVIDRDFRVIYANEAVMRKHGLDKSKVIGRFCYELSHGVHEPCASPDCVCPAVKGWNSGESAQTVHLHHRSSGDDVEERYVEVKATPLKNEGNVNETILVIRDITRAKMMEQRILVKGF